MLTAEEFYDSIGKSYNNLLNLDKILEKKNEVLKIAIPQKGTVADLGCGTGINSFAISTFSKEVIGFDISSGMLEQAKNLAEINKIENLKFIKCGIEDIPGEFDNYFDTALILGNVIPNIEPEVLRKAFGRIRKIVKTDGKLIVQLLNYHRIKKEKERIINITTEKDETFVRFYDFVSENLLNFNILKFQTSNPAKRELISMPMFPYETEVIEELLKENGFEEISFYGDLKKNRFDKDNSKDLVVVAG